MARLSKSVMMAEMFTADSLAAYYKQVQSWYDFPHVLKDKQIEVLLSLLNGHHTLGVLPTGYGKSDIFALFPLLLDEIYPDKAPHIGLVISPLKALMANQKDIFTKKGVSVSTLTETKEMTSDTSKGIKDGKFSLVMTSPEAILDVCWTEAFRSTVWQARCCIVVCDEAHCISQWGLDFRPKYKEISVLRSFFAKTPFCFLTATATEDVRQDILKSMNVRECVTVAVLPDRPNIYISSKCKPQMEYQEELKWFVDEMIKHGVNCRKTIIYCKTIRQVGYMFDWMVATLNKSNRAYVSQSKKLSERLVEQFHSSSTKESMDRVLSKFPLQNSSLRCVISTIAFGMGINIDDVKLVIHWGISKNTLQYWQEVGRAGRDGKKSTADLYAYLGSISEKKADEQMVKIFSSKSTFECIRYAILKTLVTDGMDTSDLSAMLNKEPCILKCEDCACMACTCCSRCRSRCPCNKDN